MKSGMQSKALMFVLSLLLVSSSISLVVAHTPAGMDFEYDSSTNTLTVEVTHSVSDVNTHYIYRIEVYKNNVLEETRDYDAQDSTSGMSDTFTVEAEDGDVLKATAYCSLSGQITNEITVSSSTDTTTTDSTTDDTTSETTSDTDDPAPPMDGGVLTIVVVLAAIVVVIILIVAIRKKY